MRRSDRFEPLLAWVRRARPDATERDLDDPTLSVPKYLRPDLIAFRLSRDPGRVRP